LNRAVQERLRALARINDRQVPDADGVAFLLGCLAAADKRVRRLAAQTLGRLAAGDGSIAERLRAGLTHPTFVHRWGAAYALALSRGAPPPQSLPTLLEALGDDDGDVRWAAAGILQRMRPTVTGTLLELAAAGTPIQRRMALYCLRDTTHAPPTLQPTLLAAAADRDANVRLAAISALARRAADRESAAACLLARRDDPNAGVRRAAVSALGTLGYRSSEVEAALRAAEQQTADPALQRAATRALRLLAAVDSS